MATEQFNIQAVFATDGAWTTTTNFSPTGLPVDNDRVLIRNTSNDLITLTGQGAIDLERLEFDRTVTHKIGGSGDRLTIDVQSDAVSGDGPGHLIYAGNGSEAWFTVDTRRFISRHTQTGPNACVLKHRTNDIDEVFIEDGFTKLDGGIYLLLNVSGSASRSARCQIDAGSTVTTITQSGGFIDCSATNTITTCTIDGGEFQHLKDQAVTTLNISGGRFYFDGAATFTTVTMNGGYLDLSRTGKNKVITSFFGSKGTLDLRGAGVVKFTNAPYASDDFVVLGVEKFRVF